MIAMGLDAPEDKFVTNSYPKTPQKAPFLCNFMPMKIILVFKFFLNDPALVFVELLLPKDVFTTSSVGTWPETVITAVTLRKTEAFARY